MLHTTNSRSHTIDPLLWRHNGVMASQITSLMIVYSIFIQAQIKETSKLCVTGLCAGNSPVTGDFYAQMASNAENVSISWRHHGLNGFVRTRHLDRDLIEIYRDIISTNHNTDNLSRSNWNMSRTKCRVLTQTAKHTAVCPSARIPKDVTALTL